MDLTYLCCTDELYEEKLKIRTYCSLYLRHRREFCILKIVFFFFIYFFRIVPTYDKFNNLISTMPRFHSRQTASVYLYSTLN